MLAESAVARARRSLFSRAELRERGVTEADLRKASAGGEWHRIQPGVYVAREEWETARPTDRHRFAILAAENRAREAGGVISHLSAAVLHGLPLYRFSDGPVHTTVPRASHPPSGRAVRRHTGALGAADVVIVDGLLCTSLERTVFDIACTQPREAALSCADAALRRAAVTDRRFDPDAQALWREAMLDRIARAKGRRGVRDAAWIVAFSDGRAELPGESVSRLQLHRLGFRDLDLQVPVKGPHGFDYFVDIGLRDVRTFWEFDGEVKYRDSAMRRGRSVDDVVLDEKRREDWIRGVTQWRLCRGGFADIVSPEALDARLAAFGVRSPR
ncbi:type IV toxin-antitoxin system AbiEi family antitoxin domain-containing protein [Microbacterium enclense]|uniref:Transcriptional regulator, AbiEi antitoxin, Type IV TA system n=1 Tax=Microbacterium enclense TaxID=993073 RepID=A0A1G6ML61_9MICO|nr:type IV toxin-antitoxin system AbiEi family antitoxin domain-containing protein [Microbacterium enclense]SDC56220.1 Transcriptional regulator, AbiEi antitoxin, Type IV TA system [Microbacterium enclense]